VIEVRNLTHRYGDRVALSNVSFEVKQGEIFGLLGPNGGGKSTLFRVLATMMAPTEGSAAIAGHDVVRESAAVRRKVGVVFQTQSLDKALTVQENLRAQGHLHGLSGATLRERMEGAMARLGIADRRNDLVETLSGGLRRRVEIAKALLHRPQVLLMDEASTGLDPAARRDLLGTWKSFARETASPFCSPRIFWKKPAAATV
jgi:ABC-2 type transport system ATP-binding protein